MTLRRYSDLAFMFIPLGMAVAIGLGLISWHAITFDPSGELIARPGEQVTREDGTVICTITTPLFTKAVAEAEGWCKDWTIDPPKAGEIIPDDPVGRRWIAFIDHGVKLHVGNEWRP